MNISKVAERLRFLFSAADERPTRRSDLAQQSDFQIAREDMAHEEARVSAHDGPASPMPNSGELADAHSRLKDALRSVGGEKFEEDCYVALHCVYGVYRATVEFRGWDAHLSCDPESDHGFVLWPRPMFKIDSEGSSLREVVVHVESAIKQLQYHEPTECTFQVRDECFSLTSGKIVNETRYLYVDVPEIGRLVYRFWRRIDCPWERLPYPQTRTGTLVVPIPPQSSGSIIVGNGTPAKE